MRRLALALPLLVAACSSGTEPAADPRDAGLTDAGVVDASLADASFADVSVATGDGGAPVARISASAVDSRQTVREHLLAGYEMQLAGEPLATTIGRDLNGYERDYLPTDYYFYDLTQAHVLDPTGFSIGVESYEYSKQPMNNLAFESGAGTALVFGPLENAPGDETSAAVTSLAKRVVDLADAANAYEQYVFAPGKWRGANPAGNPLGYPGLWPTVHVFRSFDPAIAPTSSVDLDCAITSDNDSTGDTVGDYECDATTLNLPARDTQTEKVVTAGADGASALKYGLWVINYLQIMHDTGGSFVASVAPGDLARVGAAGNDVVGADGDGKATFPGTYLGSSSLEGFQAGMFLEELDNRAEDWVRHLATTDGETLSGFGSLGAALGYTENQAVRWFPSLAVTETATTGGYPRPQYSIDSPDSDALDQIALAMGYAEVFALTDHANAGVGGSQPALAYFDGAPFPDDDQVADGEPTLHDRALAVMRVSLLNLDRLHRDPATGYLVDHVTMSGATPARGTLVTAPYAAYELVGLRTVLRSLSSQLELYSNNAPDTEVASTPLDAVLADGASTVSQRITALIAAQAELFFDHLTTADGHAYASYDVQAGAPADRSDSLDAHTAAVRALFQAYLATGETRYRDRAVAVYTRLESVFYDPEARLYGSSPAPVTTVVFTPQRFGLLQAILRDMINLVGTRPGNGTLEATLEARLGRLNKLVLDGWDDANGDGLIDYPGECVQSRDGLVRGGLQMAERALTGEIGSLQDELDRGDARTETSDREADCVPEIDDAKLPSALADSITFTVTRE